MNRDAPQHPCQDYFKRKTTYTCVIERKKEKKGKKRTVMSKDRLPGGQQFSIQANVCCTNHLCSNCPSCSSGTRGAFCQFHVYWRYIYTRHQCAANSTNNQTFRKYISFSVK